MSSIDENKVERSTPEITMPSSSIPASSSSASNESFSDSPPTLEEIANKTVVRKDSDTNVDFVPSSPNVFQTATGKSLKMTTSGVQKGLKFGTRLGKNIGKFTARKVATVAKIRTNIHGSPKNPIGTSTEFFISSFKMRASSHGADEGRTDRGLGLNHDTEEYQFRDYSSDHESMIDWSDQYPSKKISSVDNLVLADSVIMWVVVLSIVVDQIGRQYNEIITNHTCSFGLMMALSLLAFTVGLEMNQAELIEQLKSCFLGFSVHEKVHDSYENRFRVSELSMDETKKQRRSSILGQVFKFGSIYTVPVKSTYRTVLTAKKSVLWKQNSDLKRSPLMKSLQKFGRRNLAMIDLSSYASEGHIPKEPGKEALPSPLIKTKSDFTIGSSQGPDLIVGEDLIAHVSLPLGELRGRDIFRTEEADPDMISHPFLLR